MASFFRMVDNGIKLSSLLSIPDISDVHTMNKITSDELNRLVMHEDAPEASQLLGYLLSHIFKPFKVPLPHVSELQIPLKKIIHPNEHVRLQYHGLLPDSLVPLYNIEMSTWNWDLPVTPPGGGSDSDTSGSSHGAPVSQDPEDAESVTYEEFFASFMNALAGCLSASQPLLESKCYATHTWSAANAHKALPGSEIKYKPDLVLSDDITAKWGNIRVSADPATSTSESLNEMLGSQDPSSDNNLESVVSDSSSEECLTDPEDAHEGNSNESTMQMEESPPSLPPDLTESISSVTPYASQFPYSVHSPEPCGKIRIGDAMYIIKRILSASQGLVGCGSICYLASLGDEDFIIKDHWVLGKWDNVILNEIEMMKLMQGVPGVPELVDYWLVMTSDGKVDIT
ncbi:uncharacterized protein BJ212DRAFT_1479139 [Suillus subaureus]|uniref:Fungal-type protein kinase domain-containing protein n=1 Tax=Suillus subaureus TaxID=48587 RepID=A0A9P7EDQ9_9AGAM|nr:uncharacterized protein BJ212DRAFT_1479139 [Suillus subaureus]KAG1819011.1 hypothetical protein BJ212DRAFT_1479139 [Suillus subaureus]